MSRYNNPWSKMDGILLGYPFDQLLDQECGLLGQRRPGIKLAGRGPDKLITAGDILDAASLAKMVLNNGQGGAGGVLGQSPRIESIRSLEQKVEASRPEELETAVRELATELAVLVNDHFTKRPNERKELAKCLAGLVRGFARAGEDPEAGQATIPTGNIVICGKPGTGKSTLALQFAAACVRLNNQSVPAYISLETSPEAVMGKAASFGWEGHLREVQHLHDVDDFSSVDRLAELLKRVLSRPKKCPVVATQEEIGKRELPDICAACGQPPFEPCILMPSLSPRPIEAERSHDVLFANRLHQLERLLEAGQRLNELMHEPGECPDRWHVRHFLPLVVIDSLNMFGLRPLSRDEIYRLFTLFRRCQTTGVFVVEAAQDTPFDSTMADVVISLTMEEDQDYTLRYVEIEKSRYYHQVYGRHVFRTSPLPPEQSVPTVPGYDNPWATQKRPKHGIVVFPSLHYLVLKTDRESPLAGPGQARDSGINASRNVALSSDDIKDAEQFREELKNLSQEPKKDVEDKYKGATRFCTQWLENWPECGGMGPIEALDKIGVSDFPVGAEAGTPQERRGVLDGLFPGAFFGGSYDFGVRAFDNILPGNLTRGQVAMLEGQRGTFKTTFALNFLAKGFHDGESVLLIRLSDVGLLEADIQNCLRHYPRLSKDMANKDFKWGTLRNVSRGEETPSRINPDKADKLWRSLAPSSKIDINVWASTAHQKLSFRPRLFEIAFKGGFLLPEEFVHIVRDILIRRRGNERIRRVVLDDVSQIGVSYPFLRKSRTTGDFFLAAFVHLMRNHHMDLVMTGTTGDLGEANDAVSRGAALADTVVSCKFRDVFGDRYVTVNGAGLMAGKGTQSDPMGESVPAVVKLGNSGAGNGDNRPDINPEKTGKSLGDHAEGFEIDVDCEYLQGLVGFETGHIQRPGLSVHLYQEAGTVHAQYNQEIAAMLQSGLWTAGEAGSEEGSRQTARSPDRVTVRMFGPERSEVMHDALRVLQAKAPIDKTAIVAVDEFWNTPEYATNRFAEVRRIPSDTSKLDQLIRRVRKRIGEQPVVWPYYLNVLLLAYRKRDNGLWQPRKWQDVHDYIGKFNPSKDVCRPFWYDQAASETLACALLDALSAANPSEKPEEGGEDASPAEKRNGSEEKWRHYWDLCLGTLRPCQELSVPEEEELKALRRVLHSIGSVPGNARRDPPREIDGICLLPPDADVYMCWYSQLRDLIQEHPELAGELRVCSLPGGGFTGDWYLGVVQGSVSLALGRSIIDILCSKGEQHKRLARGVGLPVLNEFENSSEFIAWPGTYDVFLKEVYGIHAKAMSRADVDQYDRCRSAIVTVARGLAPTTNTMDRGSLRKDGGGPDSQAVKTIGRLFGQIRILREEKKPIANPTSKEARSPASMPPSQI